METRSVRLEWDRKPALFCALRDITGRKQAAERLAEMDLTPGDLGFPGEPHEVWPEIAFRFALMQPGAHTAIIGTTNSDHAETNIALADKGPLSDETTQRLREVFLAAQSHSGMTWEGLT